MLGVIYAVLAAAAFGFNNASARRGILTGTPIQGLAISMPIGMVFFFLGAVATGEWSQLSRLVWWDVLMLSGAGFMHFVWGRYFNILSLGAVGANIAAPVQQVQLLLTLGLAVWLLGESLTPLKILGILLVILAPAVILERRAKARARARVTTAARERATAATGVEPAKSAFQPRLAQGYAYALMSAIGFGTSPILIKAGLANTGLSLVGGFVSCTAATLVVVLILCLPSQLRQVLHTSRESRKWFAFSGISVSLSHFFRYLALGLLPVSVVQPMQSLSLIFRMIFGFFINREHEQFDRYVIFGLMLSISGALALSVSDDAVLRHFDASAWLLELAAWKWP
jgi:drug/metabolite transporter (DMT)-like permease